MKFDHHLQLQPRAQLQQRLSALHRSIDLEERAAMSLPAEADMISVDRNLIRAIKEML